MTAARSGTLALTGAVALVTGARGSIGRATCAALTEAGAYVVASGRGELPDDLAAQMRLQHDVTSPEDWRRVVTEVHERCGRLDCLINNAGIFLVERIGDTTLQQWRRVQSVNVEGALLGLQVALPLLRDSGKRRSGGSAVVNVSSTAALRGGAFTAAYCASKAALTLLSKSVSKEFAALRYPIRVNTIHPGAVESAFVEAALARFVELGVAASAEQQKAAWNALRPLGRMACPDEVAGGIVFLCSPAASFMTGAELVIDGGLTA